MPGQRVTTPRQPIWQRSRRTLPICDYDDVPDGHSHDADLADQGHGHSILGARVPLHHDREPLGYEEQAECR